MLESALISSVKKSWSLQNGEKLEKIKKEKKVNSAITRFGHDVILPFFTREEKGKKKKSPFELVYLHIDCLRANTSSSVILHMLMDMD